MTWLVLTEASVGATRNAGTNGDLTTLLDWALPQASWAIEYTSGNARVYRPSTGNRFRLHVNHDSVVSGGAQRALVRGCEDASAASTLVDPFPLVGQVVDANSNWLVSTAANTTTRPFKIYLSETFVFYFSQVSSTANEWSMGFFGDVPPEYDSDVWNTIISQRNSATNTGVSSNGIGQVVGTTLTGANGPLHWVRDITGATKSSVGILYASAGTILTMGAATGAPGARAGYQNAIYREFVGVSDYAATVNTPTSLSLIKRGWVPHLWNPLHNGRNSVNDVDTFTDIPYDPTASFRMLSCSAASLSGPCCIIEETDTWSPP